MVRVDLAICRASHLMVEISLRIVGFVKYANVHCFRNNKSLPVPIPGLAWSLLLHLFLLYKIWVCEDSQFLGKSPISNRI